MILLGLGANLSGLHGSPEDTLRAAVNELAGRGVVPVSGSSIWISAPIPASDQPDFRNAVLNVETSLDCRALLQVLHEVELAFGRVRSIRNEARVLDLDILAYHDDVFDEEDVCIPHPRLHERAFVLYPLREVAPEWGHPVSGVNVEQMIVDLGKEQNIHSSYVSVLS